MKSIFTKLFDICLIVSAVVITAFGFANGGLRIADAHPPCNDYTPPVCQYIQVINPYTGQLETEYVCEYSLDLSVKLLYSDITIRIPNHADSRSTKRSAAQDSRG